VGKFRWAKKKTAGCAWGVLEAILHTIWFCLTVFWFFHFETWTERLLSIVATFVCYYFIGKVMDRFSSSEK